MGDEELAEFTGIMLGDGNLGIYRSYPNGRVKTQYRIKITLNAIKDSDYSFYVSNLIQDIFLAKPRFYKRKGENTLDICLFGRNPVAFLVKSGLALAPKWNRASIPPKFMSPPFDRLVLRGYMDTDGCICVVNNNGIRYPRIELKVCPSPMQNQMIALLRSNGFEPQINLLEKGKVRIAISGLKKLRKWYDLIGFSNPRNLKIARSFFKSSSL